MRILLVVFFSIFVASVQAKPLPVEVFGSLPDVQSIRLSPAGKQIASITRFDVKDTLGVAVQVTDLGTGQSRMVLFSDNQQYYIGGISWKDEVTLLVHTWYPSDRDTWAGYFQARAKTRETRLLIINTRTGEVSSPFSKRFLRKYQVLPSNLGEVVDLLPDQPEHILMSIPSRERNFASYPMVVRVNINSQKVKTVQRPEDQVFDWTTDQYGEIRLAYHHQDGRITTRIKAPGKDQWRELWPYDFLSADEVAVLGFDKDPNTVYLSAYEDGYKALFKVNLLDKELKREPLFAIPNYDVRGYLIHSRKDGRVLGIGSGQDSGTVFVDPKFNAIQQQIDEAMPATRNHIYSITHDEQKFLVFASGPKESGTYYLGSLDPLKLKAVSYRYKQLPPSALADVHKFDYKARDGLAIEGYLTLPKNGKPKHLPTIVLPHGGPIMHDSMAFNTWTQFFADRGYAVLQMNFRGSSGHGFELRNSGLKQWGRNMQNDIEDGTRALIAKQIADPERICIVGASYGGYAALMGAVKTPDLYQCAISVNGISNVFDLVKDKRHFALRFNVVDEMIGNDNRELRLISPVNNVEAIDDPVLLIHGELDRQVDIEQSQQMYEAMTAKKKDVTFVALPGEDHFLTNEVMRLKTFKAMDDFLAKNLPVRL